MNSSDNQKRSESRNLFGENSNATREQQSMNNLLSNHQRQQPPVSQMTKNKDEENKQSINSGNRELNGNDKNSRAQQQRNNKQTSMPDSKRIWFHQIKSKITNAKNINETKLNQLLYKTAFNLQLQYFEPRQSEKQRYQKEHLNRSNFGWQNSVTGPIDVNTCNRESNTLNKIWASIVNLISQIFNINQMLVCQYLEKVLIKQEIYHTQLFIQNFHQGAHFWVLNGFTINQLHINENIVNTSSELFSKLLQGVYQEYANQYSAMIKIIEYLMHTKEKSFEKYYKEVIKKNEVKIVQSLWQKFTQICYLNIANVENKKEIQQRAIKRKQMFANLRNKRIQKLIRNYEYQTMILLLQLLTFIIPRETYWFKEPKRNKLLKTIQVLRFFHAQFTQFINIIDNSANYEVCLKLGINFLLKIFPFIYFDQQSANKNKVEKRVVDEIVDFISGKQSLILSPFLLLITLMKNKGRNNTQNNFDKAWMKLPRQIYWLMKDERGWEEWLAIFLSMNPLKKVYQNEDVLFHIIKMCKVIVSKNSSAFWATEPAFQFRIMQNFLQQALKNYGIKDILPILTKSIGQQVKQNFLQIVGFDSIRQIHNLIIQNLGVSNKSPTGPSSLYSRKINDKERLQDEPFRQSKNFNYQRFPEQQLKFFCKLVSGFQNKLLQLEGEIILSEGTGIALCTILFEWLYKVLNYSISALKCTRYLIQCIDVLFNNKQTRTSLLMGLSLSAYNNSDADSYIKDLVNLTCKKQSFSQEYRQLYKLRTALSNHLCNMISQSVYLSQYFPLECSQKAQQAYMHAENYLSKSNFQLLKQWYSNNIQISSFKTNFWFFTILLILQSDKLFPKDFQSIRLLILKMKTNASGWREEYESISFVQQILNKTNIFKQITDSLEPIMSSQIQKQNLINNSPYKLQNLRYIAEIESIERVRLRAKIDESHEKKNEKIKKAEKQIKCNVLGRISGSLELIECLLKISFEENLYPAVKQLQLYQQVVKYLTNSEQIYHYTIYLRRDSSTIPYQYGFQEREPFLPKQAYEINILQVISNLLNFEENHKINRKKHQNKIYNFVSYCTISDQLLDERKLISPILLTSDLVDNIMGFDHNPLYPYEPDFSIGTKSVLNILSLLLLKGKGTLLYNCLINHDCNILNQIGEDSLIGCRDEFREFIRQLIDNNMQSINKRLSYIFEFLTIAVSSSIFFAQQIITSFLSKLGPLIRRIISEISKADQLFLLNKIGLFILSINYYRYYYTEQIYTFMKNPTNLIGESINKLYKMKNLDPILKKQYKFKHLLLSLKLQHKIALHALYKGSIGIFIQLAKIYLLQESPSVVQQIFQKILYMCSELLSQPPSISEQKPQNIEIAPRNYLGFEDFSEITLFTYKLNYPFNQSPGFNFIKAYLPFLSVSPCAYGRNFQYQLELVLSRIQKYNIENRLISADRLLEEQIVKFYTLNFIQSLEFCSQIALNGLLAFLSGFLGVGDFGYVMENCLEDAEISKLMVQNRMSNNKVENLASSLLQKLKYRNRENISERKNYGESSYNQIISLTSLSRKLVDFLQTHSDWQHSNDHILILQSQILKIISSTLSKSINFNKSHCLEFSRLISYLLDSTNKQFSISPKVYLLFLYSCTLSYHTNQTTYLPQQILTICLKVQKIMVPDPNKKKQSPNNKIIMNISEQTILNNIFIATSIYSEMVCPFSGLVPDPHNLNRIQTVQMISYVCIELITRRLKSIQSLDLNLIGITNLTNSLIHNSAWVIREGIQKNFVLDLVQQFYGIYLKFLFELSQKNNNAHADQDSQLQIIITESLNIIHQTYQIFDLSSTQIIFKYIHLIMRTNTPNQKQRTLRKVPIKQLQSNFRLTTLLSCSSISSNQLGLMQILQLKQYLSLIRSLCSQKQYWTDLNYSHSMQSIFSTLFNQKQLFYLLENSASSRKTKSIFKLTPTTPLEHFLNKINVISKAKKFDQTTLFQVQRLQIEMQYSKCQQIQSIGLLNFTARLQILTLLYNYIDGICSGLNYSQDLNNFCQKILAEGESEISEAIWQKIVNILYLIMDFIFFNFLEPLKYNSEQLKNCLFLYKLVTQNTDIAYQTDFLTVKFEKLYESEENNKNLMDGLQITLASVGMSLLLTGKTLVQVWKKNDWKQSINWQKNRISFIQKMLDWQKNLRKILFSNAQFGNGKIFHQLEEWLTHENINGKENLF